MPDTLPISQSTVPKHWKNNTGTGDGVELNKLVDVFLQAPLKRAKCPRRPLFLRVHLLVDLSWPTAWFTEMLKVVSASRLSVCSS